MPAGVSSWSRGHACRRAHGCRLLCARRAAAHPQPHQGVGQRARMGVTPNIRVAITGNKCVTITRHQRLISQSTASSGAWGGQQTSVTSRAPPSLPPPEDPVPLQPSANDGVAAPGEIGQRQGASDAMPPPQPSSLATAPQGSDAPPVSSLTATPQGLPQPSVAAGLPQPTGPRLLRSSSPMPAAPSNQSSPPPSSMPPGSPAPMGFGPEPGQGVTIRVHHPSCINTSRERHWALLQEMVPREEWQKTAVVLACLESIYRAEYQASGQAAVAALQAANAARVPVGGEDTRPPRRQPLIRDRSSSPWPNTPAARVPRSPPPSNPLANTPALRATRSPTPSSPLASMPGPQAARSPPPSSPMASAPALRATHSPPPSASAQASRVPTRSPAPDQGTSSFAASRRTSPGPRVQISTNPTSEQTLPTPQTSPSSISGMTSPTPQTPYAPTSEQTSPTLQTSPTPISGTAVNANSNGASVASGVPPSLQPDTNGQAAAATGAGRPEVFGSGRQELAVGAGQQWAQQQAVGPDAAAGPRQAVVAALAAGLEQAAVAVPKQVAAAVPKQAAAVVQAAVTVPQQVAAAVPKQAAAAVQAVVTALATGPEQATGLEMAPLQPQPLQEPEPEPLEDAAARLDAELATLLTLLVRRSHFQPLTRREVEVAKSLNRDYLSQLFIVGDLRRMDRGLIKTMTQASAWAQDTITYALSPSPAPAASPATTANDPAAADGSGASSGDGFGGGSGAQWVVQPAAARNLRASPGSFDWCPGPLPSAYNGGGSSSSSEEEDAYNISDAGTSGTYGSTSGRTYSSTSGMGNSFSGSASGAGGSGGASDGSSSMVFDENDLAEEGEALLLLKRCWGVEQATGRLIIQKLDYLQTLAVTHVLEQTRTALASGVAAARSTLAMVADDMRRSNAGWYQDVVGAEMQEQQQLQALEQEQVLGQEQQQQGQQGLRGLGQEQQQQEQVLGLEQDQRGRQGLGQDGTLKRLQQQQEQQGQQGRGQDQALELLQQLQQQSLAVQQQQQQQQQQILELQEQQDVGQEWQGMGQEWQGQQVVGEDEQRQGTQWEGVGREEDQSERNQAVLEPHELQGAGGDSGRDTSPSGQPAGGSGGHDSSPSGQPASGSSGRGSSPSLMEMLADRLATGSADWSHRAAEAGRAWATWLSERGVGPKLDVLPLDTLDKLIPVVEPSRLRPLTLKKAALSEVLGSEPLAAGLGSLLRLMVQPVNLQEPAFKEFAVVYRRVADTGRVPPPLLRTLQKAGRRLKLLPLPPPVPPRPRPPIQIRIYRDLALPTWQLALPDKLLQFRPLDLLRADLFALTGLVALLAQAKYESLLLDIITVVSAGVFIVRIALGFKRMDDRYRNQVAEVLRDKTVASDGTALEYLAAAAGLQQFKQASLAYIYALQRQHWSRPRRARGSPAAAAAAADGSPSPSPPGSPCPSVTPTAWDEGAGSRKGGPAANTAADLTGSTTGSPTANPAASLTGGPAAAISGDPASSRTGNSAGSPTASPPGTLSPSVTPTGWPEGAGNTTASPAASPPGRSMGAMSSGAVPASGVAYCSGGMTPEEVAGAVEALLWESCGLQVLFDADEAVLELVRLGLAEPALDTLDRHEQFEQQEQHERHGKHDQHGEHDQQSQHEQPGRQGQFEQHEQLGQQQYRVVSVRAAMRLVQQHWDGILWQRVDGILREFE